VLPDFFHHWHLPKCSQIGQKSGQSFCQTQQLWKTVLPDFIQYWYLIKHSQICLKSGQIFHQTLKNSVTRFFALIDICQNVLRWAKKSPSFRSNRTMLEIGLPVFPPHLISAKMLSDGPKKWPNVLPNTTNVETSAT
jgi:hypothetical protein